MRAKIVGGLIMAMGLVAPAAPTATARRRADAKNLHALRHPTTAPPTPPIPPRRRRPRRRRRLPSTTACTAGAIASPSPDDVAAIDVADAVVAACTRRWCAGTSPPWRPNRRGLRIPLSASSPARPPTPPRTATRWAAARPCSTWSRAGPGAARRRTDRARHRSGRGCRRDPWGSRHRHPTRAAGGGAVRGNAARPEGMADMRYGFLMIRLTFAPSS